MKLSEPKYKSLDKEVQTWLEDLRQSIEEIETFLPEKLIFVEFQKDLKEEKPLNVTSK